MSIVFVAGATGVIGRATVPTLLAAGYDVRALSRSAANDAVIRDLGAVPVRSNLFDLVALTEAVAGTDAILHLATRIPPVSRIRRAESWRENDRIRSEGTHNLVAAATSAEIRTIVYPSIVYVYPDHGSDWIEAVSTPIDPAPLLRSTIAAEDAVLGFAAAAPTNERRGIVLRFGQLYGPNDSGTRELMKFARRGISIFGGAPDAYIPMLWVEDAATALLAALDRAPTGVYDVVDNEPIRQRQFASALAAATGRRRLLPLPRWLIRRATGVAGAWLLRSRRISNRRFREATGWSPSVPSVIAGLAHIAAHRQPEPPPVAPIRIGLGVLFLIFLGGRIWRQRFPRPSSGRNRFVSARSHR
ncbi:MAG: NAD(P)-dependent oxidoreductase [Chloroflexota bacterium]|nr:NAD(P)-dependent oxidoreductase [Chloroflexota bacterium]